MGTNTAPVSVQSAAATIGPAILPLKIEPLSSQVYEALFDKETRDKHQSEGTLGVYRAVGAVANVRYQSGRVIPRQVQLDAVHAAQESGRQMTMFLDHPTAGVDCAEHETHVGRLENIAGIVDQFSFQDKTNKTILDAFRVVNTRKGRELKELIDAGVEIGISQRATGKQVAQDFIDDSGKSSKAIVVANITGIFGWDFVHLPDANAGGVTAIEELNDSVVSALVQGLGVNPSGSAGYGPEGSPTISRGAGMATSNAPANVQTQPPAAAGNPEAPDAKQIEIGAKVAEANRALSDSVKLLCDTTESAIKGHLAYLEVNDSLKSRLSTDIYSVSQRLFDTLRHARNEADSICMSVELSSSEKATKLTSLGKEMRSIFDKVAKDFVQGFSEDAVEPTMGDKAPAADGQPIVDAAPAAEAPAADDGGYVPPPGATPPAPPAAAPVAPAVPVVDKAVADAEASVTAASKLAAELAQLNDKLAGETKLRGLRVYAREAVGRQKLDDESRAAVREIVDKTVTAASTHETIEDTVKQTVKLVNRGRADAQLASLGLPPKGEGKSMSALQGSNISDGAPVASLGAPHLKGVQLLTDSLVGSGQFNVTHPEAKTVPRDLQKLLDRFDRTYGADLAREQQGLQAMVDTKTGKLLDSAQAADFTTPATVARIVLFETYAQDDIRMITSFGTMDNHTDQVPITRWRRDPGGAATFKPSSLVRASTRVGELAPIPQGKLVTEFYEIKAAARKLQAVLSDEFITRARRRPDITGVAMAIDNLVKDVRRNIQQDVYFEIIRAAAAHGSATFSATKDTDGAASSFRLIGTTDANCTTIVPNHLKTPLVVQLGTGTGDRTLVPEIGTSATGGGPGAAFFYRMIYETATIEFVDSAGNALIPASSTGGILVTGYKASGETRFNLNPGSVDQDVYMNKLLFAVSNKRAQMSSGGISSVGFYDADMLLTSLVNGTLMQQAKAYAMLERRNAYNADKLVLEGNMGMTAGLGHWVSKVFSDSFAVIGDRMGTLFRQYEPLRLEGPENARDSSGRLVGGKEYYTYQEDSLDTPLVEKFALITFYYV